MKRTIKILALTISLAAFAAPALAQSTECNDENKGAWYKTFYENFKGTAEQQKTAVDAAKSYIAACPADPADKQREYMAKFVDKYDALMGKAEVSKQFQAAVQAAATSKNYGEVMRLGKQILATDPENPGLNIVLANAGLNDVKVLSDAVPYARKSIDLINAGKPFEPYKSKDQALGYLTYVLAKSSVKTDPNGAIPLYVKALHYESELKKNAQVYNELAGAYGEGPVDKYAKEYKALADAGKSVDSPEVKLASANLNQALDRQIDAFARAAAASTNPADKKAIMDVLSEIYKGRNPGNATGLDQLVATVLNTPIPDAPTPITTVPASTPSSTPAGTSGTNGTNGTNGSTGSNGSGAANNTAKPGGGNVTTGATAPAGSAKPAASPTPMAKKP